MKLFVVAAAALAWTGLWFHELYRVPRLLGFTPDGDLFMLPICAALVFWWLRDNGLRRGPSIALSIYAAINLLGAVITVLPVGFLPFVPEQALAHYFAHAVYATGQLPLLAVATYVLWDPNRRGGDPDSWPDPYPTNNQAGQV